MNETKRAITKLMEDYAATISYENGKQIMVIRMIGSTIAAVTRGVVHD